MLIQVVPKTGTVYVQHIGATAAAAGARRIYFPASILDLTEIRLASGTTLDPKADGTEIHAEIVEILEGARDEAANADRMIVRDRMISIELQLETVRFSRVLECLRAGGRFLIAASVPDREWLDVGQSPTPTLKFVSDGVYLWRDDLKIWVALQYVTITESVLTSAFAAREGYAPRPDSASQLELIRGTVEQLEQRTVDAVRTVDRIEQRMEVLQQVLRSRLLWVIGLLAAAVVAILWVR